jgi:hypothetical protein
LCAVLHLSRLSFPVELSDLPDGPLRVVATERGSIDERIVAPGSHDVTLTHRGYGWEVLTVLGLSRQAP